jgi:ketosteroid isomerase-like protein
MTISTVLTVLLGGILVGLAGCRSEEQDTLKKDLAAIEALHAKDMAAAKIHDIGTLITLNTEDCILIPPGREPIRGKQAIWKYMNEQKPEMEKYLITEYRQEFEEIEIAGDWAYEWGTFHGTFRLKSGGPDLKEKSRLFRILKRQPDGSWKCHRSIWHALPSDSTDEALPSNHPEK